MKTILISILSFFVVTLSCGFTSSAEANLTNFSANSQISRVNKAEEFVHVRVLIDGVWWIYVYTLDGSFVTAFPDEDE